MKHDLSVPSRRNLLKAFGAAGIVGLAGCSGNGDDGTGTTTADGGDGTTEAEPTNVAIIYAVGGKGDNSLSDASYRGLQMAQEEFNLNVQESEPTSAEDIQTLHRQFASSTDPSYDLIIGVGFEHAPALQELAPQFPDQNWAITDSSVEGFDNVVSYEYTANQGAYLAGILAGHATQTEITAGAGSTLPDQTRIGFVGGMDVPVVNEHLAGFKAALEEVNSEIETRVGYVGSFSDPGQAQEIATSMYEENVDIVYAGAGGSSVGVFQSAQEHERYALGIDVDMSEALPDFSNIIIASMVTGFRFGVYRGIQSVVEDDFQGGEIIDIGIDDGAGEVVYGTDIGDAIPDDIKSAVESARTDIANGDISVPNTLE